MKKLLIAFILFLLSTTAHAQIFSPPLGLQDEDGPIERPINVIKCSGVGISCEKSGTTGVLTVSGVGGDHDAVTLAGQDYLSLSTQQITAGLIKGSNINWDAVQDLIGDTQINWSSVEGITASNINWTLIDEDVITGVNWESYDYSLPTATDSVLGGVKVGAGLSISDGVLSSTGKKQICFIIDGGGSAVTTGEKAWVRAANDFTIGGVEITANQSGSCVVDLWKDTYANFPPTDDDSITASAPPTLSTAQKAQDTTLTGWTKTVTAGDYIRANVDSCSTITLVEVCIYE